MCSVDCVHFYIVHFEGCGPVERSLLLVIVDRIYVSHAYCSNSLTNISIQLIVVDSSEHLVSANIQFAFHLEVPSSYMHHGGDDEMRVGVGTWNSPTKSPLTANFTAKSPWFRCVQDSNLTEKITRCVPRKFHGKFSMTRLPKHNHVLASTIELIAHVAFDMSFHLSGTWLNLTF